MDAGRAETGARRTRHDALSIPAPNILAEGAADHLWAGGVATEDMPRRDALVLHDTLPGSHQITMQLTASSSRLGSFRCSVGQSTHEILVWCECEEV